MYSDDITIYRINWFEPDINQEVCFNFSSLREAKEYQKWLKRLSIKSNLSLEYEEMN